MSGYRKMVYFTQNYDIPGTGSSTGNIHHRKHWFLRMVLPLCTFLGQGYKFILKSGRLSYWSLTGLLFFFYLINISLIQTHGRQA